MSDSNRDEGNDLLRKTLRAWRVDDPVPQNFRAGVWDRIAKADAPSPVVGPWRGFLLALEHMLGRPAVAAAYLAVLLAAGVTVGYRHAQQEVVKTDAALSMRYVQSVDPYQAPR